MAKDTKEKILDAALEIFARDSYSGSLLTLLCVGTLIQWGIIK